MTSIASVVIPTFVASIKSVGTACTLAAVGVYLHQRGYVVGNGKRTLALISQQVTIPLLFFTKIVYCNQDWSAEPCPNVVASLQQAWILLVWPLWVCGMGVLVGAGVARIAGVTDPVQQKAMMASIAFGNSTGLPITLLTVIHANFGSESALGIVDPTLFLSVYLVVYPVLQWGIGGMMLAPPSSPSAATTKTKTKTTTTMQTKYGTAEGDAEGDDDESDTGAVYFTQQHRRTSTSLESSVRYMMTDTTRTLAHNVINTKKSPFYRYAHRGLASCDASMYMSIPEHLNQSGMPIPPPSQPASALQHVLSEGLFKGVVVGGGGGAETQRWASAHDSPAIGLDLESNTTSSSNFRTSEMTNNNTTMARRISEIDEEAIFTETDALLPSSKAKTQTDTETTTTTPAKADAEDDSEEHLCSTLISVIRRCLQPPVIGALLGLFVTSLPNVRNILVDIEDRNGTAPLQWFFDGLYEVGQAAVPINMIILGCNLSASYMLLPAAQNTVNEDDDVDNDDHRDDKEDDGNDDDKNEDDGFFSKKVNILMVVGKMIIMPIIGFISTYVVATYVYTAPETIAGGLYLVLLIVFLTPTANNVMVMVELASTSSSSSSAVASGSDNEGPTLKENMAMNIAYQYATSPILLSGTVTGAVLLATSLGTVTPS